MMTEPGFSLPAASASSIMARAIRSLTEPGGIEIFKLSENFCPETEFLFQMGQFQQRRFADQLVGGCVNVRHNRFLQIRVFDCVKAVWAPATGQGIL